jgi:hypothetical protein
MPSTKYTYSETVDTARLEKEIHDSGDILIGLDYIHASSTQVHVWMKDVLPAPQETALSALVSAHVPTPLPDTPHQVQLFGATGPEGVSRVYNPPNRDDFYMCDRDIRLCTAKMNDSFEDLRIDPLTNMEEPWGEVSLVGCYKEDGQGDFVLVADDIEARAIGRLTVWDYQAKDPITQDPIPVDFRGGRLYVDETLHAPSGWDIWHHRIYAVVAPSIPGASGGSIPFFDGYLARSENGVMQSVNPTSVSLDPVAAAGNVNTVLRIYIHYPPGVEQSHILQLVTYRPLGSW